MAENAPLPGDAELLALCDEIERLDGEATAGPWMVSPDWSYLITTQTGDELAAAVIGLPDDQDARIAALIASYRSATPRLASALRERIALSWSGVKTPIKGGEK